MKVRKRQLPGGWYPLGPEETRLRIESFLGRMDGAAGENEAAPPAAAGIAPHAGWEFSAELALEVLGHLRRDLGTLVVVGGHLPSGAGILAALEEGYETPLGIIEADLELLGFLRTRLDRFSPPVPLREDRQPDNTVEVQLPLIRYLFPQARVLALRAEPGPGAVALGEALAQAAALRGEPVGMLGSTDLTHYGSSYGFSPRGSGRQAVEWVREVNDRRLIESLTGLRLEEALERGRREKSACSIGAAVAAAAFARATGASRGRLLRYRTSNELIPAESFVGYAGIIYPGS